MADSALVGQPPSTSDDYRIIVSIARLSGIPTEMLDPSKGLPLPLMRPSSDHYPVHYPTHEPSTIAAMSMAIVLILLITGLRVGLRFFRKDLHWGWEDIVIIPAALAGIAWLSLVIAMVEYGGLGKHIYDTTYHEMYWFYKLAGIDQLIFWMTVGLVKISITIFNRRLTGLTSNRWMIAHNLFLGLLVCYLITAVFLDIFTCIHPVGIQFDLLHYGSLKTPPKCINPNAIGIALSVIHITFDFALLSVPLIVLSKIKMSTAKKIRVGFLFSVGSISCVGSVMRQIRQYHQAVDITWNMDVVNWTTIDIFFAITAASLPVLNALIPKRWRFRVRSLSRWSNSVRLGSRDDFDSKKPLPHGAPELKFHDECILDDLNAQDSHGDITASDGTVLPEVRRAASLEDDRDIEKYTTKWEDPMTGLERPPPAYWSKFSPDGLPVK